MSIWIPTHVELPKEDGMILIWSDDPETDVGIGYYMAEDAAEFMEGVTHWMPIPKPPACECAAMTRHSGNPPSCGE